MSDLIDRQEAIDAIMELIEARLEWKSDASREIKGLNAAYCAIEDLPAAKPERLRDDDFEAIRIHLNAYKERLCNQRRWEEAEEYQRIINRFMSFASVQTEQKRGKWIAVTEDGDVYKRICSCCGQEAFFQNDDPDELYDGGHYELSDFCPRCGAEMQEVSE